MQRRTEHGFTLVELVVVMVLLAVISAVGMSRFASREPFAVQGVADQLVSGLRLAQATALAQRSTVYLQLGSTPASLTVCLDAGCSQPLSPPGGGAWLIETQDVRLAAGLNFSLDPSGVPSFASAQTVQVSSTGGGNPAQPIVIEAGSGHVHSP